MSSIDPLPTSSSASGSGSERSRIAIVLPDLRGGGAERVNINLANAFVARGYSVDMVLMRATGELLPQLDPRVRVFNLAVDRVRHLFFPLVRYIRSEQPSGMLACMWPLTVVAVLARAYTRAKCRLVLAEHTTWSVARIAQQPLTRLIIRLTMRVLYGRADAIVAVSKGSASDLERMARMQPKSVSTIYNPLIDPGRAAPALPTTPEAWVSGPHKRVLAAGTLTEIKDYPTLLRAFFLVRESFDAKLLILGEGAQRTELQALIGELGLANEVFMPGFVLNPRSYFAHADLHVLSSTGEGLPSVIVEALEQGTPVVSTDCPSGPREILDYGRYGTLVPVADPRALAEAITGSLLASHDTEALRARAREFSIEPAVDQYLALLLPHACEGKQGHCEEDQKNVQGNQP